MRTSCITLAAALLLGACGGGNKNVQSAVGPGQPPPPPTGKPGGPQAVRHIQKNVREDFAKAAARWEKLDTPDAKWTDDQCNDMASMWGSVADEDATLVEARYNQGVAYQKCHLYDKAITAYNAALQENGSYAPALANLGEIYWQAGKEDAAEKYLTAARTADLKNVTAHDDLALMYLERAIAAPDKATRDSLLKQATDDVHEALAVDASNINAYTTLAEISYYRDQLNIAQLVCDQGKAIDDKWAPLYNIYGLIQLRKHNISAALAQFKHAIQLEPGYVEANMNAGAIELSVREYADAEKSFSTVLSAQPKNFDALVGLGVAYRGEGKIDDAEKEYKQAQQVKPNDPDTYFDLGLLYDDYKQKTPDQLKEAKSYYTQYLSYDAGQNRAMEKEAHRRMGNIDELLQALAQAAALEQQQKAQEAAQAQKAPASSPALAPSPATPPAKPKK